MPITKVRGHRRRTKRGSTRVKPHRRKVKRGAFFNDDNPSFEEELKRSERRQDFKKDIVSLGIEEEGRKATTLEPEDIRQRLFEEVASRDAPTEPELFDTFSSSTQDAAAENRRRIDELMERASERETLRLRKDDDDDFPKVEFF